MTTVLADATTLRTLAACLGNDVTGTSPEDIAALLDAETKVAGLENLYTGLRDGTYDHRNVPPPYLALVTGDGWHDRNDSAAILIAAALDRAHDELAALRGESR